MRTPKNVKDLVADPRNRRRHTPRNVDMIVESLERVGASRSIVIDERNEILAGNGVVEACAQAGITKLQVVDVDGDTIVAVRRRGLTPTQKRDLAIADNRSAELAEWNLDQLAADLQNGEDLSAYFLPDELTRLVGSKPTPGKTDPDNVPAERPTSIVAGDLFELGRHRLLCGDSLDPAFVDRLVPDQVATLVTSPPYWTGQTYDTAPGEAQVIAFIDRCCATWSKRVDRRIQIQTGHTNSTLVGDSGPLRKILLDGLWADGFARHGWLLRHRRIWAKNGGKGMFAVIGPLSDLIDESWEVILTFYRGGQNKGGMERVDSAWAQLGVWSDIAGEHGDGHPCPYPVAIAERMIALYSKPGDLVADPFGGSGTTLIAAETLARDARLADFSPSYCQVTIDRWEAFTGLKAVKVGDAPRRKRGA